MIGLPYNIVTLVPYDVSWVEQFNEEAEKIKAAVKDISVCICHIGSTAIPGMVSKPIIDIMLGVDDINGCDYHISALEDLGYNCCGECGRPGRIFFVKGGLENCTHHLHFVEKDSEYWKDNIMFKDYLIWNGEVAAKYANIKIDLEKRFKTNRNMYRLYKSEFVDKTVEDLKEKNTDIIALK